MSAGAAGSGASSPPFSSPLFSAGIVAAALAAGVIAFLTFLWLTAYAPDLRSGRDGGAHALSVGATGFRALGDLVEATGGSVVRVRRKGDLPAEGLLVLTPTPTTDPKLLARTVRARTGATLIIMPKWRTTPLRAKTPLQPEKTGWVSNAGGLMSNPSLLSELTMVPIVAGSPSDKRGVARSEVTNDFPAPDYAQTIGYPGIVIAPGGGALIAWVNVGQSKGNVFIAADPDLFNTMGLRDPATARAAIGLLDHMSDEDDRSVTFDLTLNGFDGGSNFGKLMFEPPFLPATLCLLVAAALAGWGAFVPLGPPIREARALNFGKRALVDGSAELLTGSGREALIAERYVALIRDAAAAKLGLDASAADAAARLDAVRTGGAGFGELADAAARARGRHQIAAALTALRRWKKGLV